MPTFTDNHAFVSLLLNASKTSLSLLALTVISSCSTANNPTPVRASSPAIDGKVGYVANGMLAVHYDRDGDGKFEECVRDKVSYFDTNGDGQVDLEVWEDPSVIEHTIAKMDTNFDGFFDVEGELHCFSSGRGKIHERVSRLFQDDRRGPRTAIEAEPVRYFYWLSFFGIPEHR